MSWQRNFLLAALYLTTLQITSQSESKSPPKATKDDFKKVVNIGDTVKLQCPIEAYLTPFIEWTKDQEKVDHTWLTYDVRKRFLRIKSAKEHDSGTFVCKGINGFGSAQVSIQLTVVDPKKAGEIAPPVFTTETQVAPVHYTKHVGETFRVACEASGKPQPEIAWSKNGLRMYDHVQYIHTGRSIVELGILDSSDSGVYSCRAQNSLGSITTNYTLEVAGQDYYSGSHAIITEVKPANLTVEVGASTTLHCKAKSRESPKITWLKRLAKDAIIDQTQAASVIVVNNVKYKFLQTSPDLKVGRDEYINKLMLTNVQLEDYGTYICYVSNKDFSSLTHKEVRLNVTPKATSSDQDFKFIETHLSPGSMTTMIVLIICLSVTVVLILLVMAACYFNHKRSTQKSNSSTTGTSESSAPESPDELHRPFIVPNHTNPMVPMYDNQYIYQQKRPVQRSTYSSAWPSSNQAIVYPASQPNTFTQAYGPSKSYWNAGGKVAPPRNHSNDNLYEVPFRNDFEAVSRSNRSSLSQQSQSSNDILGDGFHHQNQRIMQHQHQQQQRYFPIDVGYQFPAGKTRQIITTTTAAAARNGFYPNNYDMYPCNT